MVLTDLDTQKISVVTENECVGERKDQPNLIMC